EVVAELVRDDAERGILALHRVPVDLHAVRDERLGSRRRRVRVEDGPAVGPDQVRDAAALLAGPRMDDREVVDDAVPVRVEGRKVDGRIRKLHRLEYGDADW